MRRRFSHLLILSPHQQVPLVLRNFKLEALRQRLVARAQYSALGFGGRVKNQHVAGREVAIQDLSVRNPGAVELLRRKSSLQDVLQRQSRSILSRLRLVGACEQDNGQDYRRRHNDANDNANQQAFAVFPLLGTDQFLRERKRRQENRLSEVADPHF
jgi:hypothetical protein